MTSFTKPEVYKVSQRRQRRTEPQSQATHRKIWWRSAMRFSRYANGQTKLITTLGALPGGEVMMWDVDRTRYRLINTNDVDAHWSVDWSLLVGRYTDVQASIAALDDAEVERAIRRLTDVLRLDRSTVTVPAHTRWRLAVGTAHQSLWWAELQGRVARNLGDLQLFC